MRTRLCSAALAAALLFSVSALIAPPPALAVDETVVSTLEEARTIDPAIKKLTLRMGGLELLATLIERAPGIEDLHFSNPSNQVPTAAFPMLAKLPKLRTLRLTGDMFLYDEEFAAIGRLSQLTKLTMSLA